MTLPRRASYCVRPASPNADYVLNHPAFMRLVQALFGFGNHKELIDARWLHTNVTHSDAYKRPSEVSADAELHAFLETALKVAAQLAASREDALQKAELRAIGDLENSLRHCLSLSGGSDATLAASAAAHHRRSAGLVHARASNKRKHDAAVTTLHKSFHAAQRLQRSAAAVVAPRLPSKVKAVPREVELLSPATVHGRPRTRRRTGQSPPQPGGKAAASAGDGALVEAAPPLTAATFMLDSGRRTSKLPAKATEVLLQWFLDHQDCPYPTASEKKRLAAQTGLKAVQVRNWFTNIRKRHWGPIRNGQSPRCYLDYAVLQAAKK